MSAGSVVAEPDELLRRAAVLYAIPRALTGDGVRQTLAAVRDWLPELRTVEVPSGTAVLDWRVPEEWNLRRATLTAPDGTVVADSDAHLLHVMGYSEPVERTMTLDELEAEGRLHSLPDQPQLIPWRTSYYRRSWGFCLPHHVRTGLQAGEYRVSIDASLERGHLTYGELVIGGVTNDEILLTSHTCHPAMANDNVSGNVVATAVAEALTAKAAARDLRHTIRMLFIPGTIGSITWLARNRDDAVQRVVTGLVLSGIADPGPSLTYKRSRLGTAPMDAAMTTALRDTGVPHEIVDYEPWGYDERHLNSLGFDLGVGLLNRTRHGTYPEYHTSADDLAFISGYRLRQATDVVLSALEVAERDGVYLNLKPHGEPQLGPRGLYPSIGGPAGRRAQLAMLWVLGFSDGRTSLCAIAARSKMTFAEIADAADKLAATDLLMRLDGPIEQT